MIEFRIDGSDIARLGNLLAAAGDKAPLGIMRALRHTGDKARTKMRRATAKQLGPIRSSTGGPYAISSKAIKGQVRGMSYVIESKGGNIRLRFYRPKETRSGVSHGSPKRGSPIAGAFMHGGRFPNRHGGPGGGQGVYRRTGTGRYPLKSERSDMFIPDEMISGGSAAEFFATAERELPDRLAHELLRILGA